MDIFDKIAEGRTDLVFEHLAAAHPSTASDKNGVSLIKWCAYYGDVSAIKYLLAHGESLESLRGELNGAAFHGHWRLCQFLLENGANPNQPAEDTGETPLHSALSKGGPQFDRVVKVLLAKGAMPNVQAKPGAATGAFMRDTRTRGETPLHRAAAFGSGEAISLLLEAGAAKDVKDSNGDSPLSWASWHLRPDSILRMLCYGPYQIRQGRISMAESLLGEPHD